MTVQGRVQGVGFRAATAREARRLAVDGWVRNLPDGSVEVEARGVSGAVDTLVAWLRQGPPSAHVRGIDVYEPPAGGQDPTDATPGFFVR